MGHKPLYRQIADRIREQIARGELKPAMRYPLNQRYKQSLASAGLRCVRLCAS